MLLEIKTFTGNVLNLKNETSSVIMKSADCDRRSELFVFGGEFLTIDMAGRNKIIVILSKNDLENYNVAKSDFEVPDMHSRKMLNDILRRAEYETGVDLAGKRLKIDALAFRSGCMMIITISENRRIFRIIRRSGCKRRYVVPGLCAAMCCLGLLYLAGMGKIYCSLFKNGDEYIVEIPDNKKYDSVMDLVALFATGKRAPAGIPVFIGNAVSSAGKLIFCK